MANLLPGKHALIIGLGAKRMTAAFLIALITPSQNAPKVWIGCSPSYVAREDIGTNLRRLRLRLHLATKTTNAVHPAARGMNFVKLSLV